MADISNNTPSNQNQTNPALDVKKKPSAVKRFFRKFLLFLGLFMLVLFLGIWAYFSFPYSKGNRAGALIKFSEKGYIFKTYEGEMNLGGVNPMPGNTIVNNIWTFSVKDKTVADDLMEMEGKEVRLHYIQYLGKLPWRGETEYMVDRVEEVQ